MRDRIRILGWIAEERLAVNQDDDAEPLTFRFVRQIQLHVAKDCKGCFVQSDLINLNDCCRFVRLDCLQKVDSIALWVSSRFPKSSLCLIAALQTTQSSLFLLFPSPTPAELAKPKSQNLPKKNVHKEDYKRCACAADLMPENV